VLAEVCEAVGLPAGVLNVLTADREVQPDDTKYRYRERLRNAFASFGIFPSAGRPDRNRAERAPLDAGAWCATNSHSLRYDGIHQEAMRRDPDEVFRFIWANRHELRLYEEAFSRVISVRPCRRTAPDGAPIQETVVELMQIWEPSPAEMRRLNLGAVDGAVSDAAGVVKLYGGGTFIFDDFGRLKYHIHNSVTNLAMQKSRLSYLRGAPVRRFSSTRRFAEIHRLRAMASPRLTANERW